MQRRLSLKGKMENDLIPVLKKANCRIVPPAKVWFMCRWDETYNELSDMLVATMQSMLKSEDSVHGLVLPVEADG